MIDARTIAWPAASLGEAVAELARVSGLVRSLDVPPRATPDGSLDFHNNNALGHAVETIAGGLGVEAEPIEVQYADVDPVIRRASPVLLVLPGHADTRFLALCGARGANVRVLGPDLLVHRVPRATVRALLCGEAEAPFRADIDRALDAAEVPARRRDRSRDALLQQVLGGSSLGRAWLLRPSPGTSFWRQLRQSGLHHRAAILLGGHTGEYLLWLASWAMVGRGALEGRLDPGWLLAWALLLLTIVPFHMLVTWSEGVLAIGAGGLLKQRLLFGALKLEPEEIRHQGAGAFLGRVIEAEAVESLALGGGILAFLASVELVLAALVLAAGGARAQPILLGLWVAVTLLGSWIFYRRHRSWTGTRLSMTHDLIERLVGHRTRLAQEAPDEWHRGEDEALARYLEDSRAMDRADVALIACLPRGWLVLGLAGMAPGFVSGAASPALLAVNLGGILLAYRALQKLVQGLSHLAGAAIAWQQAGPLFRAAARDAETGVALAASAPRTAASGNAQPILQAHDVAFRYAQRSERVLHGCNLEIRRGERLLMEGPSGGGKSTLASLLSGLRVPEAGLLLLDGFDRQTLGSVAWRRRVAAAPQFHENHVLTETFAFNLLMGRSWPASEEDIDEAERICRELGLGDLLERMPSGMLQMVGESGWQLSHGERSRLFIARALLQHADLVVLDESFASLDPETMERALRCVLARAPTLLVVAHP